MRPAEKLAEIEELETAVAGFDDEATGESRPGLRAPEDPTKPPIAARMCASNLSIHLCRAVWRQGDPFVSGQKAASFGPSAQLALSTRVGSEVKRRPGAQEETVANWALTARQL